MTKIPILVNGECNHASTHFETEEFDTPNPHGQDSTHEDTLEVCDNCGSYRSGTFPESEWQGIPILPVHKGEVLHG